MQRYVTENAPAPVGPYCQALSVGNLLFISGQMGIDPKTGAFVSGGVEAQAEQVMKNLDAILTEAGSCWSSVAKVNIYLKDMNDFAAVNQIYAGFFDQAFPARCCVEVARLPKDALVEIEAIAVIGA
ncbi:MAG: RidA family protein [Peptococcaceae bacterium]|jgi:2-iminobutanoate/2-iminopropanoate deaminase|nr:RidA family protein [Peptococcaceae bacterium]